MKLPRLAIDNYQFTLIVFFLLTIAGISSYVSMPRTENPAVYIPGAGIVVVYPGASPLDMEQLVASPIEEAINELDDIVEIKTTVLDGISTTVVEFSYDTDPDKKFDEVTQKVNGLKSELPQDIFDIFLRKFTSTDVAMLQLAMASPDAEYDELNRNAEKLKKQLDKIEGVRKVEIHACPQQEVRISMDIEKMSKMNTGIENIINAVGSSNANIPGGSLNIDGKTFSIKTSGSYSNLDEIRNTVVNNHNGRLIYMRDIATVEFDYEDQIYAARYNGTNAIFITLKQKDGYNIFDIMERIDPVLNTFRKDLDNNIELGMVFDQSEVVDDRISGFISNLLQGIFLVGLVILLALGFRSSLIVIVAIPLSILVGLFFVDLYGLGLQQITIAALVVALGLLVDNSIVIIENINRMIQEGMPPREAAINGTAQIGWPIVSSTITTLFAFIPIIMMPDKAGDFIRGLPVTIIATLTVSMVVALTLSPLIARLVLKKKPRERKDFQYALKGFIHGPYRRWLDFALRNRALVITVSVLILIGSGVLFKTSVGVSFFPSAETPQFLIRVNLPEGSSLEKTDEAIRYAEAVLDSIPDVRYFASNIGHGNPRVYYNVFAASYARNYGDIYVQLKDFELQSFYNTTLSIRKALAKYPGAKYSIKVFEQGIPTDAPVMVYIEGDNVDTLKSIADKVEQYLFKQKGAINIENQLSKKKTDLYVNINKEKANLLGIPIHEIDKTVRIAMTGAPISKFRNERGEEYNIVVRMPEEGGATYEDFSKIYVKSLTGKLIPLDQVAGLEFREAPSIIKRRNLGRTALVTSDLERGYSVDDVMNPVIQMLEDYPFPPGYDYHIAGEIKARGETFGGMGIALIIAVIAIFAVLVLQFKSFLQPLIIFVSFILALIGVVWALFLTGSTFSFTAFIGFISLAGIVVNNAIILVDYTNQLRKDGMPLVEALKMAGETRFTPILLTTLTTIGGLLPLTLQGGEMWAPLGWTIIGGLMVSTILTLIVIPVLYHAFENSNEQTLVEEKA